MSEEEKLEQIGALVSELSRLKGLLAHAAEKLHRAQQAYAFVTQNWASARVVEGKLLITPQRGGIATTHVEDLLNEHQLLEVFSERDRMTNEIKVISERLKPLAPYLF